jgi:hypothetical protein
LGLGFIANWLGNFLARFTPMSVAFWLYRFDLPNFCCLAVEA